MADFLALIERFSWFIAFLLALGVLFGLFLRRRRLAERATRAARGEDVEGPVTLSIHNRARIQFLMTLGIVVLLILIWALQT